MFFRQMAILLINLIVWAMSKWTKLIVPRGNSSGQQLVLRNTLVNGQCFNWYPLQEHDYIGVLDKYLIRIKQDIDNFDIHYRYHANEKASENDTHNVEALLHDYFQFQDIDLEDLYKVWSKDKYFASIGKYLPGLRILRQNTWECTISFLVSQNNNIKRITQCLRKIRAKYGSKIGNATSVLDEGEEFEDFDTHEFYSFPTWAQLSKGTEAQFRELGLGYRANYIEHSVKLIKSKGGEKWLNGLRINSESQQNDDVKGSQQDEETKDDPPKSPLTMETLEEIRESLIELKGVGKKVADWIALFSMNCHNSIPVDTHVHQIANRVYGKSSKEKVSMNDKIYSNVVSIFNKNFGDHCGWAHSVLFAAELPAYKKIIDEQKGDVTPKKRKHSDVSQIEENEIQQKTNKRRKVK